MARQSVYKRARHTVDKQKKRVILQYMRENPDLVINSSVTVIKGLRLKFALDILRGRARRNRMKAYMDRNNAPENEEAAETNPPEDTKQTQG